MENKTKSSTIPLEELQCMLADMLGQLHSFFEENGISYFMASGTMLGAVRHKGFIPWDDDVDIGIPRSDFKKLLSLRDMLPPELEIKFRGLDGTHKNYPYLFAKIENCKTRLIEKRIEHLNIESGLYIDVFPFDGAPDNRFLRWIHRMKVMPYMIIRMLLLMDPQKKRNPIKAILVKTAQKLFSLSSILEKVNGLIQKYEFDKCNMVCNYSDSYDEAKVTLPKEVVAGGGLFEFEGYQLRGVADPDGFLTRFYGNYKKLPPLEQRIGHHEYSIEFI